MEVPNASVHPGRGARKCVLPVKTVEGLNLASLPGCTGIPGGRVPAVSLRSTAG
jgi:hypothetical protein